MVKFFVRLIKKGVTQFWREQQEKRNFFFQLVCYCYSFQKLTMDVIKIKQIVVGFITDTKML